MGEVITRNVVWGEDTPPAHVAKKEYSFYLKQMRKAARLSSSEVAKRLGISQANYSNYERGAYLPRMIMNFHMNFKKVIQQELYHQRISKCK